MERLTLENPRAKTMALRRILAVLAMSLLLLVGCATQPTGGGDLSTELERGRRAWLAGDFREALPDLLAAAEAGEARAQYALGYMYYYGQGVEEDADQAMAWIKRAAANGDKRAVEALSRLADTFSRAPRGESDGEPAPPSAGDAPPRLSPPEPQGSSAPEAAGPGEGQSPSEAPAGNGEADAAGAAAGAAWLEDRNPEHFTIQLLAAHDEDTVIRYLEQARLPQPGRVVATEQDGDRRLLVLMGDYPDRAAAEDALSRLPEALRESGPWLRRFGTLIR